MYYIEIFSNRYVQLGIVHFMTTQQLMEYLTNLHELSYDWKYIDVVQLVNKGQNKWLEEQYMMTINHRTVQNNLNNLRSML